MKITTSQRDGATVYAADLGGIGYELRSGRIAVAYAIIGNGPYADRRKLMELKAPVSIPIPKVEALFTRLDAKRAEILAIHASEEAERKANPPRPGYMYDFGKR